MFTYAPFRSIIVFEMMAILLLIYWAAGLKLAYLLLESLWSPLRSVPGPPLARFTNGWYFWRMSKAAFEKENIDLHKKYGPIVRYGPRRYSFADPEATKIIYGHGTQLSKSHWYSASVSVKEEEWNIFAERNIKAHASERKQYSPFYAMSSVVSYEPFVDECIHIFRQRLTEIANTGLATDIGHWFQCYAFDVMGLMTYNTRLGFLNQGDDVGGVISAIEHNLVYSSLVGIYDGLHEHLSRLFNLVPGSKRTGFAFVNQFTRDRIKAYQDEPLLGIQLTKNQNVAESFLSKFQRKHKENPTDFTAYHIVSGCIVNMAAGSDTTAITLSATLYYLITNPECLRKLREEIDKESLFPFRLKDSQDMQYLQAVIKEVLRLHPATGLPLERVVPKGGIVISGRFFPENTIVGVNAWVEHNNTHIFGEDAGIFRPERWLTDDANKLADMNRHWIPFGVGSRVCLGRHISLLEMGKLIPHIVRDFNFELPDGPGQKWKTKTYWFVKPKGFKVRVALRSGK